MKHSKTLLLASAALLLSLTGASFAHDAQAPDGQGQGWKGGHHHCMNRPQFTEAQKDLLRSTWQQTHKENKPLMEKLHQLRKEMAALNQAPTFDQQAFLDKSAEAEKIRDQISENRMKAFVGIAPQFSPEERKFLLKMAMHRHHRHGHHHGGHHGGWMQGDKKGGWGAKGGDMQQPDAAPDAAPAQ